MEFHIFGVAYVVIRLKRRTPGKFHHQTLCAAFGLGDLKQSAAHLRLL